MLCAAVSKVIAVFCREANKDRKKVIVLIHYLHKVIQYVIVNTCVLEELYFDILSNLFLLIMPFPSQLGQMLQLRRH